MFYVNNRWLGGMLTNFTTIKKSLLRLKKLEKMEIDGTFENMTKKEVARLMKERSKLEKNLGGIKEMKELPGIIFIIDTRKEAIAVTEAKRVKTPIAAVVDTNCNPEGITFPIPGNDDAIRAINLFTQIIANAVIEAENEAGLEVVETLQEEKGGGEEFVEAIDKGDFAAQSKYDKEEEVEKVAVGAVLGAAAEEPATGFTDKDYSNYNPDEAVAGGDQAASTEEPEIDEDKLYKD
jgi:small subunit ribosomal protein S2